AELQKLRDNLGVKAQDATTLVITLSEPEGFFLTTLFNGAIAPVNANNIEKNKERAFDAPSFVGSGPFMLSEWQHKDHMTLVPNPYYYGGAPKISLRLVMIKEPAATLAAYKNGEIDTIGGVQLSAADVNAIRSDPAYKDQTVEYTELSVYGMRFNVSKKPLDNVKVRQAISYAIDRKTLVDKVLAGQGEPATSLIPPGMPGYVQEGGQSYDPAKAKALLAEGGYPDGKGLPQNITVSYNNLSVWPQIMQFVQANLQAVGISIQLDSRESATYFKQMREDASPMFRDGWNSDYPDPDDWYRIIFLFTSSQNYGHYKNDKFDQLVRQAATEPDMAKRLDLYKQANDILQAETPEVYWYWPKRIRLFKSYLKGVVTTGQDGGFPGKYFLKDVTIQR